MRCELFVEVRRDEQARLDDQTTGDNRVPGRVGAGSQPALDEVVEDIPPTIELIDV